MDEPLGENRLYVFYENKIKSQMTGEYLKIYSHYKRGRWSQLKKWNVRNSVGSLTIYYPITKDEVNDYLEKSENYKNN